MSLRISPPERLVRVTVGRPEIDRAKRTIRTQVMTRNLARDGGIVKPEGILTRFYEENPVVMARHGMSQDARSPVIGRSLGLTRTDKGMLSVTQFADTELGREYAYLYGLNDETEVFMRAWSFGWKTLDWNYWSLDQAQAYLGMDWDAEVLSSFDKRMNEVWVSVRSEMHEYSAVPVGADRDALSRAFADHDIRAAGELVTILDSREAQRLIAELRHNNETMEQRVKKLEADMKALRRDGAAAAARGDFAAIVRELTSLRNAIKGDHS